MYGFLVCLGGGITGDIQVAHLHHLLKVGYRQRESELMVQQLSNDPLKIPSPSRDDMTSMLVDSWDSFQVDITAALKKNFILSALDGSEDLFVRDKLSVSGRGDCGIPPGGDGEGATKNTKRSPYLHYTTRGS